NHSLVRQQPSGTIGRLIKPFSSPTAIPPEDLAAALTDVMIKEGGFAGTILSPKIAALLRGNGNIQTSFHKEAVVWFKDGTDPLSGDYKRRTQRNLLIVALLVAFQFNVDTFQITRTIAGMNAEERGKITTIIEKLSGSSSNNCYTQGSGTTAGLPQCLELSLGKPLVTYQRPKDLCGWLIKLSGWLVTGFASSLGAHVWFNLLQAALRIGKKSRRYQRGQV
ncbi:MAG: hypothetical protein WCK65_14425, partial [Rhodospirillaceae bacterium]